MNNFEKLMEKSEKERKEILDNWTIKQPNLTTVEKVTSDFFAWLQEEVSEETLKPCPFCGRNEAHLVEDYSDYPSRGKVLRAVKCGYCGAKGMVCNDPYYAVEAWNERAESGKIRGEK